MKRIAFIINPISGVGKKKQLPFLIQQFLDLKKFRYKIMYTEYRGHAFEIAKEIVANNTFEIVAIVGGDGSINEVGRALIHTDVEMAIIPAGSGNGFARHFSIPCDIIDAIKFLNRAETHKVDSAKINEHHFFVTAGLGFDARVAHEFDEVGNRGLFGYAKAMMKQFKKCKNIPYEIEVDNKVVDLKCFVLTIANTTQYGNNFHISPNSISDDGQLELITLEKPDWLKLLFVLLKGFRKNIDTCKDFQEFKSNKFVIHSENLQGHVDGDPIHLKEINVVEVLPKSLKLYF